MSASPGRLAGALIGAVAGVASGMLGIGGGLVVTPALALRGVPLRRATGTALGAVLVCALVAVATEYATEPGHLFLLGALLISVGAQLGVFAGRALLNAMPDAVLRTVFLLFLLFSAARSFGLLSAVDEGALPATQADQGFAAESAGLMVGMMALGIPAGISSVLFGIGGGVVVVPLLLWMGAGFAQAAAISLLAMIPTALTGLWVARRDDRIERGLLATLLPTAAAGAAAGVWLRNRALDAPLLETLFGVFLLYAALRLWMTRPRKV